MRRAMAVAAVVGLASVWPALLASAPAAADEFTYQASAQAPVFQITEDRTDASFHPEGDGDYNYAEADLSSQGGHALSSVVWPGAAGGHAGSLAVLLGGPSQADALNDPAKAEAGTGTGTDESTCCPAGTGEQMTASVKPPGPTADASLDGGGLGSDTSVGNSTSHASSIIDANNVLTATATSAASKVNIATVVTIGSVTSSATAVYDGRSPTVPPKINFSGGTVFNDMKVAGQPAYVDSSGVHLGRPGKPAGSEAVALVNQALKNFGMTIYTTEPATFVIAGTSYFYAGSILVYWHPPSDQAPTFTFTIGGAAVAMAITPANSVTGPDTGPTPLPSPPNPPTASLPTDAGPLPAATPAALPGATVSQPVRPRTAPARATSPFHFGGVGAGALIVAGLLGVGAAVGGPRLPGLLAASAKPGCELERLRESQRRSRP